MIERPGCALPGNDWSSLVPPAGVEWEPSRRVSICIPTRNPGHGLRRTLACLAAQTYPHHLLDVVVADDGGEQRVDVPDGLPFSVEVVEFDRTLDFAAGQARNVAAARASGDILMFLDADVIPERQAIESYARWFEACDLVVPMGLCRFVDVADVADDELVALISEGGMGRRFAGDEVDEQQWRETHFGNTRDLRDERVDVFRVVVGATLAVSAEVFRAVGGFPELGVRGVEDTGLGYRLHNDGAILLLDRDAAHWHQGRRTLSDSAARARVNEIRAPYVASVMPVAGFRDGEPPDDPPTDVAPVARVRLHGGPAEVAEARRRLERSRNFAVTDEPFDGPDPALLQIDLPASVGVGSGTIGRLNDLLRERPVGVIRALVEGSDGAAIVIARTRALRRAQHVDPDRDPVEQAAELFGQWWVSASSLGFRSPFTTDASLAAGTTFDDFADDDRLPVAARLFDQLTVVLRAATR